MTEDATAYAGAASQRRCDRGAVLDVDGATGTDEARVFVAKLSTAASDSCAVASHRANVRILDGYLFGEVSGTAADASTTVYAERVDRTVILDGDFQCPAAITTADASSVGTAFCHDIGSRDVNRSAIGRVAATDAGALLAHGDTHRGDLVVVTSAYLEFPHGIGTAGNSTAIGKDRPARDVDGRAVVLAFGIVAATNSSSIFAANSDDLATTDVDLSGATSVTAANASAVMATYCGHVTAVDGNSYVAVAVVVNAATDTCCLRATYGIHRTTVDDNWVCTRIISTADAGSIGLRCCADPSAVDGNGSRPATIAS